MQNLALIFFISLALFACDMSSEEDANSGKLSTSLQYDTIALNDSIGDCSNGEGPCAEISFTYPNFTNAANAEVLDSLNAFVVNRMQLFEEGDTIMTMSSYMQLYLDGYQQLVDDMPEYRMPWSLERNMDVLFQNDTILSLSFYEYVFSGGAHPNSATQYYNFDLSTGKRIGLDDLFTEGYRDELNRVGEYHFRMLRRIPEEEKLEDQGFYFETEGFSLNDNFAINGQELIFYFNSYEIAPYAMGPTEIHIPLYELSEYLKPEFKKEKLTL